MAGCNSSKECLASQEQAAAPGEKYGGLVPKKKPLISKDHKRAFFDSADWALGKQGGAGLDQKSKAAVETLRPKLQVPINNHGYYKPKPKPKSDPLPRSLSSV